MISERLHITSPTKPKLVFLMFCLSIFLFSGCSDDEPREKEEDKTELTTESFEVARITISTENNSEIDSKETYVSCTFSVESDNSDWNYSGSAKVRGRGNSTWLWYPKKPYRIKLDKKAEILGLKADKDWVLLADYRDPTHLMNAFVFTVGKGLNLPYTNNVRYAEVTLNDKYIGLYLLTEQVEQGENRVAIDSVGGVLISLDVDDGPELSPDSGDNFWSSVYRMPVCVKSPETISTARLTAVKSDFARLENTIKNANYSEVEQELDIPLFIDFMLIQELVYNVEVDAPRSIYFYKESGGRWKIGPLWDFDAGFDFDWGTMYTGHNYFHSYKELVLGTSPVKHTSGYWVPGFFTDLFQNKQFVEEYKQRWLAVKDKIMSEYWVTTQSYADGFSVAMENDAERWPINKSNDTEIRQMEQWLSMRIDYLSGVIENYPEGTK